MVATLQEWINPVYLDAHQIASLRKEFETVDPFSHLELQDFFIPQKLMLVLQALSEEAFYEKESDLFKFKQSNDLKHTQNPVVKEFISFLYSDTFIEFVEGLTGLGFS